MNNEEIKQMLRELSDSAEAQGKVKSRTLRISFNQEDAAAKKRKKKRQQPPEEEQEVLDAPDFDAENESADGGNAPEPVREIVPRRASKRPEPEVEAETADAAEHTEEAEAAEEGSEESGAGNRVGAVLQSAVGAFGSLKERLQEKNAAARERRRQAAEEKAAREAEEEAHRAEQDAVEEAETAGTAEESAVESAKNKEAAVVETPAAEKSSETNTAGDTDVPGDGETRMPAEEGRNESPDEAVPADAVKEENAESSEAAETVAAAENAEATAGDPAGTDSQEADRDNAEEAPAAKKREIPVEPADFESDADDFRSPYTDEAPEESGSLRDRFKAWLTMLEGKGIGRKEQLMLLAGAALIILILIIGMSIYANQRKTEGVTADEGLRVTVESKPTEWTSSGEVTLGIRTSAAIQSVSVNGETCDVTVGETKAKVSILAETESLQVMVVAGEDVLNAVVDIPMIDADAPEVTLSASGSMVTIQATDTRSGLADVYYGKITGLSDVPAYQPYTGPFEAEAGALYAYYATDLAGNMTGPETTDMTPATGIEISDTKISLFPGDTAEISAHTVPENAFANDMIWTVSDTSVISLENGTITALADGEAEILVSAAGLETAVCQVSVRSTAEMTISMVGDMTLGDDVNFSPLNSFSTVATMNGTDYFLQNVKDIFSADDLTFGNLEGTLTDQGTRQDKTYAFRGDPSYVDILTSGSVEAVTLANNHSSDYGEVSLTDTQKYLTEAGIDYCMGDQIIVREAGGIMVGLVGIYALDESTWDTLETQIAQTIDEARRQGAQVIIAAFHWGTESMETPDEMQQTLAHAAIDHGADLVVGHHPHVLQGIEIYEGKYIAYSLGNFCFGGNSNPSDLDTMILQATFSLARTGDVEMTDLNIIPCMLSSDSSWNNYQPTPATGEDAQRIMDKINVRSDMFGTPDFTYEG